MKEFFDKLNGMNTRADLFDIRFADNSSKDAMDNVVSAYFYEDCLMVDFLMRKDRFFAIKDGQVTHTDKMLSDDDINEWFRNFGKEGQPDLMVYHHDRFGNVMTILTLTDPKFEEVDPKQFEIGSPLKINTYNADFKVGSNEDENCVEKLYKVTFSEANSAVLKQS